MTAISVKEISKVTQMSAPFQPQWISIKEITTQYAESREKEFSGHDRANTTGSSEVGQCIRKSWFNKNDIPGDPDYIDRWGAKERGNNVEDWVVAALDYWYPPEGVDILYTGHKQRTLVDGYISATSDGLFTGVARDCLAWLGVPDIGPSRCIVIEIKSLDPRVELKIQKAEHEFQVHTGMGLLRACTPHKPDYALIVYINCSFYDDQDEFAVKYDPAIYAAAQTRARRIMTAVDPAALHPEGKMAGGNECKWCSWQSHCADVTVASIPADAEPTLSEEEIEQLGAMARDQKKRSEIIDTLAQRDAETKQLIKDFLREHKIRRYHGEDFSVAWTSAKPRSTLDQEAARAAGIDLSPYEKLGNASDRLTIKVK